MGPTQKLDQIIGILKRNLDCKDCNGDSALLQEILDQLKLQTEEVEPLLYCDEECNITGAVSFYRPEDTEDVTAIYFDATLQTTATPPTGKPCGGSCGPDDYEFKFFEKEKCLPDGTKVVEVLCLTFINGEETSTETFWIVDGVKTTTVPIGIIECVDCDPQTESFLGDNATLTQFNNITVIIPKCCKATITTSAGTITIPSIGGAKVITEHFDCFVSDYQITSTCVDEITTILTKTK